MTLETADGRGDLIQGPKGRLDPAACEEANVRTLPGRGSLYWMVSHQPDSLSFARRLARTHDDARMGWGWGGTREWAQCRRRN